MNSRPVTRYKTPRYPTRLEVLDDHTLLEKHLPPAWKSCAEMAGMVTLLLAANSNMGFAKDRNKNVTSKPAVVAPIFEHGEGRGAVGCVVINPPVFLSEQDAMQVIREKLSKAGVALSATREPFNEVVIPQFMSVWDMGERGEKVVPNGGPKVLLLSALDPQKRVGVEYVSSENYADLGGVQSASTVHNYDFKEIAAAVDKSVAKGHDIYFGAFYDPTIYLRGGLEKRRQIDTLYDERGKLKDSRLIAQRDEEINRAYDELLAPARAASRDMLQHQVKDFIDWLKGQGVI